MKTLLTLILLLSVSVTAQTNVYTVTAYCACKKCCGPNAMGITASGKKVQEGVTIAASRSIPFGTKMKIEGVGIREVQDRLHRKYDNRIDIFFNSHEKAKLFGIKRLKVEKL